MSKSNPLFVDSTKIGSDSITTRIELSGVELSDGQSVYIKYTDISGAEQSSLLKPSEHEQLFVGKVWMNHQQEVEMRFYIMGPSGIEKTSRVYLEKATYLLELKWDDAAVQGEITLPSIVKKAPKESTAEEVMGEMNDLSSLIDKWGL